MKRKKVINRLLGARAQELSLRMYAEKHQGNVQFHDGAIAGIDLALNLLEEKHGRVWRSEK